LQLLIKKKRLTKHNNFIENKKRLIKIRLFLFSERERETDPNGKCIQEKTTLTARRKANISSWPDSIDIIPVGAPPEPTLPSAKTFLRSFPPSISVSNWKLEA